MSRNSLRWRKTRKPKGVRRVPRDSFLCASNINDINIMFLKTFYMTREISQHIMKSEKTKENAASEQGGSGLLYSDQIRRDRARLPLSHVHMSMTNSKLAPPVASWQLVKQNQGSRACLATLSQSRRYSCLLVTIFLPFGG